MKHTKASTTKTTKTNKLTREINFKNDRRHEAHASINGASAIIAFVSIFAFKLPIDMKEFLSTHTHTQCVKFCVVILRWAVYGEGLIVISCYLWCSSNRIFAVVHTPLLWYENDKCVQWREKMRAKKQKNKKTCVRNPMEWDFWKINFNYVRNSTKSPGLFNNNQDVSLVASFFFSFSQIYLNFFFGANITIRAFWQWVFFRRPSVCVCGFFPRIELHSVDDWIRINRWLDSHRETSVRNFTPQQKYVVEKCLLWTPNGVCHSILYLNSECDNLLRDIAKLFSLKSKQMRAITITKYFWLDHILNICYMTNNYLRFFFSSPSSSYFTV